MENNKAKNILSKAQSFLQSRADEKNSEKSKLENDRKELVSTLSQQMAQVLTPSLEKMAEQARITREEMREIIEGIKVQVPEISIPEIKVPEAKITIPAPIVNIPAPIVNVSEREFGFPDRMSVGLEDYSPSNPIPVRLFDKDGKPFQISIPGGGATGGKADFFTIVDIKGSTASLINDAEGALKVTGTLSATTTPFATYYASDAVGSMNLIQVGGNSVSVNQGEASPGTLRVVHAGDVGMSVSVTDIFGSTGASIVNPDGRLKVELPTGTSGLTDAELRATAVPVSQLSGASWSTSASIVSVSDIFSTTAASTVVNPDNRVKVELPATTVTVTATDLDIRDLNVTQDEVLIHQVSGSNWSTNVTNTVTVTGSLTSTVVVGPTVADAADGGNAPVQTGGIARTANPTAVAANDVVKSTYDDLGRQVIKPLQVRDLIKTAYVSITNGTETTLLAAVAGSFLDCIAVMASNNSDAAVSLDVRAVTAGSVVHTIRIPANGTAGWAPPIPWPQDATGNNWTIDGPDETGRTITVSALFSQEV